MSADGNRSRALPMWVLALGVLGGGVAGLSSCGPGGGADAPAFDTGPVDCSGASASAGQTAIMMRGCTGCHDADLGGATRGTPGQNLTPMNLGTWTDGQIVDAMLDGISETGAPLCSSMTRFRTLGMTEAQACDIVAHLRSLAPIDRTVTDTCM